MEISDSDHDKSPSIAVQILGRPVTSPAERPAPPRFPSFLQVPVSRLHPTGRSQNEDRKRALKQWPKWVFKQNRLCACRQSADVFRINDTICYHVFRRNDGPWPYKITPKIATSRSIPTSRSPPVSPPSVPGSCYVEC